MGDGNKKIIKAICTLPPKIFALLNWNKLRNNLILSSTQSEFYQCGNSCYNGNKSTMSFNLCKKHVLELITKTTLDLSEINVFCKWCYYMDALVLKSKSKYKIESIKHNLNKIPLSQQQRFQSIIQNLNDLHLYQKKRILCDKNGINHNFNIPQRCDEFSMFLLYLVISYHIISYHII